MSQNTEDKKVVSLFAEREKRNEKKVSKPSNLNSDDLFENVMQKNKEVSDRMKREREKKNKSVLRSYRIKN